MADKKTIKSYIGLIVGYSVSFLLILIMATLFWNIAMPKIFGLPRLNILDMTLVYVVINILRVNWLRIYGAHLNNQVNYMEKNLQNLKDKQRQDEFENKE